VLQQQQAKLHEGAKELERLQVPTATSYPPTLDIPVVITLLAAVLGTAIQAMRKFESLSIAVAKLETHVEDIRHDIEILSKRYGP
jgi:ABC-type Fe3+-hydroxamate transport system substrate-binding protein